MGFLQMLLSQMQPGQQDFNGSSPGHESAPIAMAHSKIAKMFGMMPGAQGPMARGMGGDDEAQMSAPRMEAQRRINRMFGGIGGGMGMDPRQAAQDRIKAMFSGLPQTPEGIHAAIGADRDY